MTIDEAIQFCTETAADYMGEAMQYNECDEWEWVHKCTNEEYAANYRQLTEWLKELKELRNSIGAVKLSNMKEALELIREYKADNAKQREQIAEYKRLLKLAICELGDAQDCDSCIADCSIGTDCIYKWHCSDEAKKLIGDEPNGI